MFYLLIKIILWCNIFSVIIIRICMLYDSLFIVRIFNSLYCSDNWVVKYEKVINFEEIL